jgi:NAD(P)H-dependent glutamate synthase small subunit
MAKPTGFLEYQRQDAPKRPVAERITDFKAVEQPMPEGVLETQAARCMDCGIPFCHMAGCPLKNLIPEWNDLVYRKQWREALELLHSTNNFPEITGRICPAPCEAACTLGANDKPVTIRQIELALVERGWAEGWITPKPAAAQSGKRIAIVGSGPAGLAAAQQLARAGHRVRVYEHDDRIGGVLRYGIPDFKLEKWVLDRRIRQMEQEGVAFETSVRIGEDIAAPYLRRAYDAVLFTGGARIPRDMQAPGRELAGVHFAMDFLTQQNRLVAGDTIPADQRISAKGRHVLVIGGGDTGADCVGTSVRQGAAGILQIEILPRPPEKRDPNTPWPLWPNVLRTSSSHEEGGERRWSLQTKEFLGKNGKLCGVRAVEIEWKKDANGRFTPVEKPGSEFEIPCDLALLAMGFTKEGNVKILNAFGVTTTPAGDPVLDAAGMTNLPGVFVAGDLSKGASLVVRAIADGRAAAASVSNWLAGKK